MNFLFYIHGVRIENLGVRITFPLHNSRLLPLITDEGDEKFG